MKPFNDRTFCCTGMVSEERHDVEDKITTLGGTVFSDLMSLVQFLIVGDIHTDKYRYSVRYRPDITFLLPLAIQDIYKKWTLGEDTGMDPAEHKMPVFLALSICVARVERPHPSELNRLFSARFRTPPNGCAPANMLRDAFSIDQITECLAKNGGSPSASLTPGTSVLVGTDTYGRRYTTANQWKIPAVHPLWVYDSCLRGAALCVEDYLLSDGSVYDNGLFVWKELYSLRLQAPGQPGKPAEHRPADRLALKRSSDVWSSIMGQAYVSAEKNTRDGTWDDAEVEEEALEPAEAKKTEESPKSSLFAGFVFLAVGFSIPQQNVLRSVVESHSGEIADSADDDTITHVLLLVKNGPQAGLMLLSLPSSLKRRINNKEVHTVTDWFIERLIFYNEVRHDSWCKLLPGLVPLQRKFKVCITGFTGVELLHIEKLIKYLNFTFCDVLSADRDLLIVNVNLFRSILQKKSPALFEYRHLGILDCPVTSGDEKRSVSVILSKNKINAAKKWNIPIVSLAYLWEMIARLAGEATVQMPDICDLSWCIYAPTNIPRPTTMLDYVRKLSNNFQTQSKTEEKPESPQLPLPRKAKDKHKYGRLATSKDLLTEKLRQASEPDEIRHVRLDDLDDEPNQTQVGYVNQDSVQNNEELMKKLAGEPPTKRARRQRGN